MGNFTFDSATAQSIKRHYQEEYSKTLNKLHELKSVLEQMSGVDPGDEGALVSNELTVSSDSPQADSPKKEAKENKPKRSYTKKRGRKSIWGKFIKSRLKATQTPLSYDDMTYHAIAIKNLEPADFDKTRQKIVAAAFALRNKQDVIDTYAIKGSRTKYMGYKAWFEREGLLKEEYRNKIKA
ncbi:MAG: hypothetical protein WBA16_07855 [Nonlabens sp.]